MSLSVLYHTDERLRKAMHRINGVLQRHSFTGKNLKAVAAQMINYIDKIGDLGATRREQQATLIAALKVMVNREAIRVTKHDHDIVQVGKGRKSPRVNQRQEARRSADWSQPVGAAL